MALQNISLDTDWLKNTILKVTRANTIPNCLIFRIFTIYNVYQAKFIFSN